MPAPFPGSPGSAGQPGGATGVRAQNRTRRVMLTAGAVVALVLAAAGGARAVAVLGSRPLADVVDRDPRSQLAVAAAGEHPERAAVFAVERLLRVGERLPPAGTAVDDRTQTLRWVAAPDPAAPAIAGAVIQRVRLRSGDTLLRSLLDDDPTYTAAVDVVVSTADGRETPLRFVFWDYGLLLPWGLSPRGDGLKPSVVRWGAPE